MTEAEFIGGPMDGKIGDLDDLIGDDIESVETLLSYTVRIGHDLYKFKKDNDTIRLIYAGKRE
jgi:hypothetical protein